MRIFPAFLTVILFLTSGPIAAEQHADMVLVRGEPVITMLEADVTQRPRPGQGDGYVQTIRRISDGAGYQYYINDSEAPDTEPFAEYRANYSFTSPPLIIEPNDSFEITVNISLSGKGKWHGFDLVIGSDGFSLGELGSVRYSFVAQMDANQMPYSGERCGLDCYIYEGSASVVESRIFNVWTPLPDEVSITAYYNGEQGSTQIVYPYTLQPRPEIIERDGGGGWFGAKPTGECRIDTSRSVNELTHDIDILAAAEDEHVNRIRVANANMEDPNIYLFGEGARIYARTRAQVIEDLRPVVAYLLIMGVDDIYINSLAPWMQVIARASVNEGFVLETAVSKINGKAPERMAVMLQRRQALEYTLELIRERAAELIEQRRQMRHYLETGDLSCTESP